MDCDGVLWWRFGCRGDSSAEPPSERGLHRPHLQRMSSGTQVFAFKSNRAQRYQLSVVFFFSRFWESCVLTLLSSL